MVAAAGPESAVLAGRIGDGVISTAPDSDVIQAFKDAGFDHVYIHQVGPRQEGFIKFYAEQILPRYR